MTAGGHFGCPQITFDAFLAISDKYAFFQNGLWRFLTDYRQNQWGSCSLIGQWLDRI